MEFKRAFCKDCDKPVKAERNDGKKVNHILHLVLSLLTGGIWLLVWLFIILLSSKPDWSCSICGSHKLRN